MLKKYSLQQSLYSESVIEVNYAKSCRELLNEKIRKNCIQHGQAGMWHEPLGNKSVLADSSNRSNILSTEKFKVSLKTMILPKLKSVRLISIGVNFR